MRRVCSSTARARGRSSSVQAPCARARGLRFVVCQALDGQGTPSRAKRRVGRQISKHLCVDTLEKALQQRGALAHAALSLLRDEPAQAPAQHQQQHQQQQQQQPHQQQHISLRFPSCEFRSLALNPLAKSGLMAPFPDRGIWNRHKVDLATLVLELANGDGEAYERRLNRLVEETLDRETSHLARQLGGLADPDGANSEERERLQKRHETRRKRVQAQLASWCESTVHNPRFQVLKPVLQKVLEVEPVPQIDNKRDGLQTEMAISQMLLRELPPGWSIHTQCRLVAVDGEPFRNEKNVKGEADCLMVDPSGIVQAILEVKTAKGNPYLALYEDLQRLRNMTEKVRGRLVAFVPAYPPIGHNPSAAASAAAAEGGYAAAAATPSGAQLPQGGSSSSSSSQPPTVTLRFSKSVRKVYVLGSSIAPEEMNAVARSAQSKLMSLEFGRVLSTQIDAWRQVKLVEVNREATVLQVPHTSFPECQRNIRKFYTELQGCDIFLAPIS